MAPTLKGVGVHIWAFLSFHSWLEYLLTYISTQQIHVQYSVHDSHLPSYVASHLSFEPCE